METTVLGVPLKQDTLVCMGLSFFEGAIFNVGLNDTKSNTFGTPLF